MPTPTAVMTTSFSGRTIRSWRLPVGRMRGANSSMPRTVRPASHTRYWDGLGTPGQFENIASKSDGTKLIASKRGWSSDCLRQPPDGGWCSWALAHTMSFIIACNFFYLVNLTYVNLDTTICCSIQLPPFGRGFKSRYTRLNAHISNEVRRDASHNLIYNFKESNARIILDANTGKEVGRCPSNSGWCYVSGATESVFEGGPSHPYNLVRVFNFNEKEIDRFDMPPSELTGLDGYLMAVSHDGKKFLYARNVKGSDDTTDVVAHYLTMNYSLYDAESGKKIRSLGEYEMGYAAAFSPDGSQTILLPTFGSSGKDIRDPTIIVVNIKGGKR